MKLIIAEKPMLARAIAAAIPGTAKQNDGYTVKGEYAIVSAFGHLLTLKDPEDFDAERYKKWSLKTLPIYFEDWGKKPGPGKEERLTLIGQLLKSADCVIHAGDPDDEGQYLIDEILTWFDYKGPVYRLATGDTTEGALKKALASMKDNKDCVNAGWSAHARSVADIMVGYNFSRFFTMNNPQVKMLTVGRVQTPTLGLVVARDMAIENHEKQVYCTIYAKLAVEGKYVDTKYEPARDDPNLEDGRITDADYAAEIVKALEKQSFDNIKVSRKQITEQPPLPFNLVKLQTYCSNKFGYDPSQTLSITQALRDEHNAITYNRSDCQYLSQEQYKESPKTMRQLLENLKGTPAEQVFARLPIDTTLHSSAFNDKNITAHTAIIPQNRRVDLSKLTEEQRNVYMAIAKYFVAQFLPPAEKERTSLEVSAEGGTLKASSTKILSPGYLKLIKPEKKTESDPAAETKSSRGKDKSADPGAEQGADTGTDDEERESELSQLAPGTYSGVCEKACSEEKETKAPPRYTKASLNEDMTRIARYVTDPEAKRLLLAKDKEKKGENGSIGTSATRSGIIDTLEQRGYIVSKGKQIQSTVLGRELYRILPDELKKPDMTGLWWAVQESIREGTQPWTALTDSVLEMIKKVIKTEYPKVDAYRIPEEMRRGKLPLGFCPRCGEPVIEGTNGFGCSGYKKGCRFVVWKTAKSGKMVKTEITGDMVHTWLSGEWEDEQRPGDDGVMRPTGKRRSKNTVPIKKLYSEAKGKNYQGQVYLTDDGPASQYGASFGIESIVNEPPKSLGKCPRCGADVVEGKNGYGCSAYEQGCRFVIWKKAKSGMMSKMKVTKGVVRTLLKSPWIDAPEENAPLRRRTEKTVHLKKLYSPAKDRIYSADVYLYDDGPDSPYGASFAIGGFSRDEPEVLGKCPRCGRPVLEAEKGYGCTGYKDGCTFMIWKNSRMKLLANITFTKTDAKKFLAGKPVRKRKLIDKKGKEFTAEILMVERADDPYGPIFRVVENTIEVKEADPSEIRTETVPLPEKKGADNDLFTNTGLKTEKNDQKSDAVR